MDKEGQRSSKLGQDNDEVISLSEGRPASSAYRDLCGEEAGGVKDAKIMGRTCHVSSTEAPSPVGTTSSIIDSVVHSCQPRDNREILKNSQPRALGG